VTTSAICYETLDYFSSFCQIREGGASVVVADRGKWALDNPAFITN